MAKLAIFHGIMTYFWHFHRLRPHLCSIRGVLGFYNQATQRRSAMSLFSYFGVYCSWLGMARKGSILDQKWPNMAGLSTLQSGPKGSKRDQNGQPKSFWTFGPIWTLLDNFKQELIFCSEAPLQNPTLSISGKKIIFCLKWSKRAPNGQKHLQGVSKKKVLLLFLVLFQF